MALCCTRALGGHVEVCPECGDTSATTVAVTTVLRQNKEREVWIEMRKEECAVKHFHVVFTVPDCLHPIAMRPAGTVLRAVCPAPHGPR